MEVRVAQRSGCHSANNHGHTDYVVDPEFPNYAQSWVSPKVMRVLRCFLALASLVVMSVLLGVGTQHNFWVFGLSHLLEALACEEPQQPGKDVFLRRPFYLQGGNVKSGIRPGCKRLHWVEPCAELAWAQHDPTGHSYSLPCFFLRLLATSQAARGALVLLSFPTHNESRDMRELGMGPPK